MQIFVLQATEAESEREREREVVRVYQRFSYHEDKIKKAKIGVVPLSRLAERGESTKNNLMCK